MTVEARKSDSHKEMGWEIFTDKIIEIVNKECENIVFILWGSYAQKKGKNIDTSRHYILKAPHPSPLSAYRGFFGSRPFSKTNEYLTSKGRGALNWQL